MFRLAVQQAGVRGAGRLSLHSQPHGYASTRIGSGLDVVFVSRQLGHANPSATLKVYAHVFARREHADRPRAVLSVRTGRGVEVGCGRLADVGGARR